MKGLDTEGKDVDEILEEVMTARRAGTDPKDLFGGPRDWIDSLVPAAVLMVSVLYVKQPLRTGIYLALGSLAVLIAVRLVRRETLRHAFSGVVGVGVSAFFAWKVGDVKGFFLPGIFVNVAYGGAFLISALVRHPLVGVIMRVVIEKPKEWHEHPVVKRAYTEATLAWSAVFLLRVAVKGVLYLADKTTLLGIAHGLMGYPLYFGALALTVPFVKRRTAGVPVPEPEPSEPAEPVEPAGSGADTSG